MDGFVKNRHAPLTYNMLIMKGGDCNKYTILIIYMKGGDYKMVISYDKLFALIDSRGLKATTVLRDAGISTGYYSKLRANKDNISVSIILRLCSHLNCQPSDICEVISEEEYASRIKTSEEREIEQLKRRLNYLESKN